MIKKNNKSQEFIHFTKLSEEWWNPEGKFKILHTLTPIRINYIKSFLDKKNISFKNLKILDLGCGGGLVCEPLARLGASVTGIDFVSQNINVAKKHARESKLKIRYSQMDIKKISLKEKYDLILMFEILEHLDDWKNLIKKMKSLLKPKGILIVSTINRTLLAQILAIFVAENILNWVPKNTHNFKKLIKPEELIYHLKKNKFKVIDLTGLVFKPISAEWRLDKKNTKINYFCTGVRSN